jgi:predicted permease
MRGLRVFFFRLRGVAASLWPVSDRHDEFAAELESHIAMHVEDGVRAGLSAEEARRQALLKLGGAEQTRQAYRERQTLPWLEHFAQDVRYALRGFRRNPVFAITAILTIALGIGSTTAVFSVVDRILFRALPYAQDDRIVSIGLVQSLEKQEFMLGSFFYDWRDQQRPFSAFASQGTSPHACDLIETNPAQLGCIEVQAGFLPMLGIAPVLGRNFSPDEDKPHGPPVALISYALWKGHFGGDPGILSRQIDVDGHLTRVIGVLPQTFELPTLGEADVVVPMALNEGKERKANPGHPMRTFARLKPGLSVAEARAEMEPLFLRTQQTLIPAPLRNDFHLSIRSLRDRQTQDVQLMAWILLAAVLAVLLIACGNVAGLMMARGGARERELAVRSALGASRARLIRQTLTEAFLLSLAGAAAGMALAEGLLRAFLALAPTGIPFLDRVHLDLRIAGFTVLLALAGGTIVGIFPALEKPRSLAAAAQTATCRAHAVLRRGLVVGQIAASMILLAGAALLLRSFAGMELESLGVNTRGILSVNISLPDSRYDTGQKKMQFYLQAEEAARRLPGVRAVGWSDSLPPGGWSNETRLSGLVVAGRPQPSAEIGGRVTTRLVTPDYFRALDIPILQGRNFSEEDRSADEPEMIVSRLLAASLFPGENPIGQRIQKTPDGPWYTVVGVAQNVKNEGLTTQDEPEVYLLRRNVPEDWSGRAIVGEDMSGGAPMLVIDTILSPKDVTPWVRAQIAQLDPTVPVGMETLTARVNKLADRPRFETALLGFFAFTGLAMAVIGLYGVIAFMATQRTREIGVRMALGASRVDILRLIAGEGLRLIVLGGGLGLVASLCLSRLLKSLLFDVSPYDPASFLSVTILLAGVALAATLIPARAAMRTNPTESLRAE